MWPPVSFQRILELLLGLDGGFLARDGAFSIGFRPRWPWQDLIGVGLWNLGLLAVVLLIVVWAYRRDGRSRGWRITLGGLRLSVLVLLLGLLNRPTLSLERVRIEPSVVAVLVDTSASMSVSDIGEPGEKQARIAVAKQMAATAAEQLGEEHSVRVFAVDALATQTDELEALEASGGQTSLAAAAEDALRQLRGQNIAGLLLLSDGRDSEVDAAAGSVLRQSGVPLWAVPIGEPGQPVNVTVESISAEPTVFAGDVLNVVARVRARGLEGDVVVRLLDEAGEPMIGLDNQPITTTIQASNDEEAIEVELQWPTGEPASVAMVVAADTPVGVDETDLSDNRRTLRVDVLEANIRVLYVDGYPRWEYRYLKNRLLRDETIDASILLTSADPNFAQEGNTPIRRFPVTAEELQAYDVVLFGDVSPRQFGDGQLELIREFVGDRGGGFGMVAGPRSGPWAWQGTAIEAILPVDVVAEPSQASGAMSYRPVVTDAGRQTGIFRFYGDREANDAFIANDIRELYWFADGIRAKAGVGDVLAEHPDEVAPDGRPAPLLIAGRYGAGRTLFNGIDESWRWRYYTGESVFDTFWVQQLRYLARGRKLGERRASLRVSRPSYEVGERASAELRVLDPRLAGQLPDRVEADISDADGNPIGVVPLIRRVAGDAEGGTGEDRYTGTYSVDRAGSFTLSVSPLAADVPELADDYSVELPRIELRNPATDFAALGRLADESGGRIVERDNLESLTIEPKERRVPVIAARPLWDAPIAFVLLALLLTFEWVGRKMAGLI